MAKKRKTRRHSRRLFGINPGSVTEGFKPRVIRGILPMGVGALTNTFVTNAIANKVPFIGNSAILRILTGVGTAGIIGYAASRISKRDGIPAFLGAMTATGIDAIGILREKYTPAAALPAPKATATAGATPNTALTLPAPVAPAGVAGYGDEINIPNDGTVSSMGELYNV